MILFHPDMWGKEFINYHQAKSIPLEKLSFSGTSYWSIEPLLLVVASYTRSIAPLNQKWLYRSSSHELVFLPGTVFYRINGMAYQTLYPIQAHQGKLYFSEPDADRLICCMARECNFELETQPEHPVLQSDPFAPPKILDITLEKKVNGYLIIITSNRPLWDKLDFDFSLSEIYWINLNILNGQTSLTESQLSATLEKPIRQVKIYRFGKSIQFSFRLAFPIEKLELKTDTLTNQLVIILRQSLDNLILPGVHDKTTDDSLTQSEPSPSMLKNHGSIRKIVIDAGHGGKDPGTIGKNYYSYEKIISLDIAQRLKVILKEIGSFEIVMTRDQDVFVSLDQRRKIANLQSGDLFISIHCNSIANPARRKVVRGFETYFLSLEKNDQARETARLENSAINYEEESEDAESSADTVKSIVFDLLHNSYLRESSRLAEILLQEMDSNIPSVPRKVDQANLLILKGLNMPGVLVEVGFLSHANEEKELLNEAYRQKIAEGLKSGLVRFIEQYAGLTE